MDDDADDDADCGDEFVGYNEWARDALGVSLFTDFVYDYEDGERGVFVAEDIAPQTCVLRVPFASLLTLEWLREQAANGHGVYARASLFAQLVDTPRDGWDMEREDDLLALALLYERFVARAASRWRPHVELLPTQYDNPLYFTDGKLHRLRGSNVFLLAQQMQRKVQEDYERVRATAVPELVDAALAYHADATREALEASFSIDNYKWALSTIWSRFVSLRMLDDGERSTADDEVDDDDDDADSTPPPVPVPVLKAMAPVFDMLNHDPFAEVSHGYNAAAHALEVVTHQHVAAGTQLCINYGAVSNQKLLTLYGFVVPDNPFDTMEVWLPMDEATTPMYAAKVRALHELGVDHELTPFELSTIHEEDVDPGMLLAARVIQLECRDETELLACVERIKDGEIISDQHEACALRMLIHRLESMLAQLTLDEDAKDREPVEGGRSRSDECDDRDAVDEDRHARHVEMITVVRESDERILEHTIGLLQDMLANVLPTQRDDSRPNAS